MTRMMSDEDAAKVLGCDVNAAPRVVKERFRTVARAMHPDLAGNSGEVCDLGQLRAARDQLLRRYQRRSRPRL